ncbi:MAG: ABC transporter ATP-binding protein, partial [Lachnospiraceae bacterium]|nr:ABC transporter ATP-binding protein [Lachnospiraceae bacterium]
DTAEKKIEYYGVFFERVFVYDLSDKSMRMDFQHTEDPEVLNQQNKAKEGISWYSVGVTGMLESFFAVIYNFFLMCTSVTIFIFYCPLILPVQIIGMAIVTYFNAKKQKVRAHAFLKLGKVNRLFSYFLFDLSAAKFGKDIRLYDSVDMLTSRSKEFGKESVEIFRENAEGCLKYDYPSQTANAFRDAISYAYMGYRALMGLLSLGDLTMCISAASRLFQSLLWLGRNAQDLMEKCGYAYHYIVYLEYSDALSKGDKPVKEGKHEIVFENVSFKYPRSDEYVLKNINFKISSGEHISIVGLNGAGKTTFIKLLCRLYDVTEGRILIDGIDIRDYSTEEYRKLFAVVFQDFQLFAFSLKDNIAMGRADEPVDEKKIEEALKLSGLYDDAIALDEGLNTLLFKSFDEHGTELSGGQRQKAAISRALYRNAPIVILDEPTAALDPLAEYEIYKKFDALVGGKSAIYISHRLSSCRFCDRIAVFADNTIKECGTHDELVNLKDGIYAEMFAAQAQYYVDAVS